MCEQHAWQGVSVLFPSGEVLRMHSQWHLYFFADQVLESVDLSKNSQECGPSFKCLLAGLLDSGSRL